MGEEEKKLLYLRDQVSNLCNYHHMMFAIFVFAFSQDSDTFTIINTYHLLIVKLDRKIDLNTSILI